MAGVPPLALPPPGVDQADWDAACEAVRSYCGWHIAPSATETVTVDGPGGGILLLPTLHLTALENVTNDGQPVADPEWSQAGMVRASWSSKFRGVSATMTHGYDTCPPEVLAIVKDMADAAQYPTGVSTLQAGPFSATLGVSSAAAQAGVVGIADAQKRVLDRYKIPGAP